MLQKIDTPTGPLFLDKEKIVMIGRADIGVSAVILENCPPVQIKIDPQALVDLLEGREPAPPKQPLKLS